MLRYLPLLLLALFLRSIAAAQGPGIVGGFPYTIAPDDTLRSRWLPSLPAGEAGAHGFLESDGAGGFRFADGTPARFFGVTLQWDACFPDSLQAPVVAGRLAKLGVNLVRMEYFENGYDWGESVSILDRASGFRTLHPERMRRFDRFIAELKRQGIYTYLTLQSSRPIRREDGLGVLADSSLWAGLGMYQLYPQAADAGREIARQIMQHRNPFTGTEYRQEPAIAMLELLDRGSMLSLWRINYTTHQPNSYSFTWSQSRRLDTLFSTFLRKKYGSTAGLATAWKTVVPAGGFPNRVREGSFEGDFDSEWTIAANEGSISKILVQGDSVPSGALSLTLRVRNTRGNIFNVSMQQPVALEFNKLYRLTFRAKSSNPEGRNLYLYAYGEGYDNSGLNRQIHLNPWWTTHEVAFLNPLQSPIHALGFFMGDVDGDVEFDDIQLREFPAEGLQANEAIETATVIRIPWNHAASYLVTSKRMEDQSEFYIELDRNYYDRMRRFLSDTVAAGQPITGSQSYWASGYMDVAEQGRMDFSAGYSGWDGVGTNDSGQWYTNNYSPLRQRNYAGGIYELASKAHIGQPFVAGFTAPYPNRYQAESMTMLGAYSRLNGWDGLVFDAYASSASEYDNHAIDSALYSQFAANPVILGMMPVMAQTVRMGLLKSSAVPVRIQHTRQQELIYPRLEPFWNIFAVPGGIPGFAMAAAGIGIDSIEGEYFTQRSDIDFPTVDGEVRSDTREINWEFLRGVISLDAPGIQGASGAIGRAGGIRLANIDIDLLSTNETATVLLSSIDSSGSLATGDSALLTVISRSEPTGWHWVDTSRGDRWGRGPMLLDPVQVRITFGEERPQGTPFVWPLDSTGTPVGPALRPTIGPNGWVLTIDQRTTRSIWYGVQWSVLAAAPDRAESGALAIVAPADADRLQVMLPGARNNVRVELFDALGRSLGLLYEGALGAGERAIHLDRAALRSGVYMARLTTEKGEMVTARFTVAR